MENVIDFPWYKAYDLTPLSYFEQRQRQKKLFYQNFRLQSKQVLLELENAKVKPLTLVRVVDEETPSITRYTARCWIITQEKFTKPGATKIGSNKPPTEITSFKGLAITPDSTLFQYGATPENIKRNEVLHVNGLHLYNDIPDEYIDAGATASADLILGLVSLSPVQSSNRTIFAGLSSVK